VRPWWGRAEQSSDPLTKALTGRPTERNAHSSGPIRSSSHAWRKRACVRTKAGSPLGAAGRIDNWGRGKVGSVWEHMRVRGRDCGSAGVRGASVGAHGVRRAVGQAWPNSVGRNVGAHGVRPGNISGQAKKGARWMPRHGPAKKDVVSCEKRRGAAREL
jgi:hypothetical protein